MGQFSDRISTMTELNIELDSEIGLCAQHIDLHRDILSNILLHIALLNTNNFPNFTSLEISGRDQRVPGFYPRQVHPNIAQSL